MATIQEYAKLSNEVYTDGGGAPGPGWEPILASSPNTSGYYGVAYYNSFTHEVVIAHRGTQILDQGDLRSDWQIALGQIPAQTNDARAFYAAAIKAAADQGLTLGSITQTGHSLGGAIARTLAVENHQAGVLFDPPGYVGQVPTGDFSRIEVYRAFYDVVSHHGTQVGNVHSYFVSSYPGVYDPVEPLVVFFAFKFGLGWIAAAHFGYSQHSMDNLLSVISALPSGLQLSEADVELLVSPDYEVTGGWTDEWQALEDLLQEDSTLRPNQLIPDGTLTPAQIRDEEDTSLSDRRYYRSGSEGTLLVGGNVNDSLLGGGGNDILFGDDGDDQLSGGTGADLLIGGAGTDLMTGDIGDDLLAGGAGFDTYNYTPGDGADTIIDTDGEGVLVYDPDGKAQVLGVGLHKSTDPDGQYKSADGSITYRLDGDLTIETAGGTITVKNYNPEDLGIRLIDLTPDATAAIEWPAIDPDRAAAPNERTAPNWDYLRDGTPYNDRYDSPDRSVDLFAGNSVAPDGSTTPVYLHPGPVQGSGGADIIHGFGGDDDLWGNGGGDRIFGDSGDDLIGTSGDTTPMYADGGTGRDIVDGDEGDDHLLGGADDDALQGLGGDDHIEGGSGNDILADDEGSNILEGGTGNDYLLGSSSYLVQDFGHRFEPQNGIERSVPRDWTITPVTEILASAGWQGNEFFIPGPFLYEFVGEAIGSDASDDVLLGGAGSDYLLGGLGDDFLDTGSTEDEASDTNAAFGYLGDDILVGGDGRDYLNGDSGNDVVFGGRGDDILFGDGVYASEEEAPGDDYVDGGAGDDIVAGNGGNDTLLGGDGDDKLLGEEGDDYLSGGDGQDILDGGLGADILDGGAGADTIFLDGSGDIAYLDGADQVHAAPTASNFTLQFDNGDISQAQISQQQGSDGAPWLQIAFDADNVFLIQNGLLDRNQTLVFGGGNLTQRELMQFAPALDFTATVNDDVVRGSNHDDRLDGGAGNDTLDGQGGNDLLIGSDGDDVLISGTGDDLLRGGAGNDAYVFNVGDGEDTVSDVSGTESIHFGAGIVPGDVTASLVAGDLVLNYGTGDVVTVAGWATPGTRIESVVFDDATVWDATEIMRRSGAYVFETTGFSARESEVTVNYTISDEPIAQQSFSLNQITRAGSTYTPVISDVREGGDGVTLDIGYYDQNGTFYDNGFPNDPSGEAAVLELALRYSGEGALGSYLFRTPGENLATGAAAITHTGTYIQTGDSSPLYFVRQGGHNYFDIRKIIYTGTNGNDTLGPLQIGPTLYSSYYYDGAGDDVMIGTGGPDIFVGGPGNDTMYGGVGFNNFWVSNSDSYYINPAEADLVFDDGYRDLTSNYDTIYVHGWQLADLVFTRDGDDLLIGSARIQRFFERDAGSTNVLSQYPYMVEQLAGQDWHVNLPEHLIALGLFGGFTGTEGDDTLTGDAFDNRLFGLGGDDILQGRDGTDSLYGGAGDDDLYGQSAGNSSLNDRSDYLDGGEGSDYLEGDNGDDTLLGGAGEDVLLGDFAVGRSIYTSEGSGWHGRDILDGGAGEDFLNGEQDGDTYLINRGGGTDAIQDTGPADRYAEPLQAVLAELATLESYGSGTYVSSNAWDYFALEFPAWRWLPADIRDGLASHTSDVPAAEAVAALTAFRDWMIEDQADVIQFGPGITQQDLVVQWHAGLTYVDELGDTIDAPGFLWVDLGGNDGFTIEDFDGGQNFGIERFRFSDGSELSLAQLLALDTDPTALGVIVGTNGDDSLVGSQWFDSLYGNAGDDVLAGNDQSDNLYGGTGADILVGGRSLDNFYGDAGSDVYLFNAGDSDASYSELISDWAHYERGAQDIDTLSLGGGITAADLDAYLEAGDNGDGTGFSILVLRVRTTGETLAIDWTSSFDDGTGVTTQDMRLERLQLLGNGDDRVFDLIALVAARDAELRAAFDADLEVPTFIPLFRPQDLAAFDITGQVPFAGGTYASTYAARVSLPSGLPTVLGTTGPDSLHGTDLAETLYGMAGDDLLRGSGGNDILQGGLGADVLVGGDGDDTYVFNLGDGVDTVVDTATAAEGNEIFFGDGITSDMLSLDVGSLLIRVGDKGDAIHIERFSRTDALGPHAVERFQFVDGSSLTYAQLIARGFDLSGTSGGELLRGTNVVDRIAAFGGDDQLAGGQGNDFLSGGDGNDTYLFNIGDGIDTINDSATGSGPNRIRFGAGIAAQDLNFSQTADVLTITVGLNGDAIRLIDFDASAVSGSLVAAELEFADGSVLALTDLLTSENTAPVVANPLADRTLLEDSSFTFTVPATTFTDADVGDILALSATRADGSALPGWLSFNPATRTFSGVPTNGDVGTFDLRITATDPAGALASDDFSLTVENTNDAPTVAASLNDQSVDQYAALLFQVPANTFSDADLGDSLSYSASLVDGNPLPTWLQFDPTTRTFTGRPTHADIGNLGVRVTATDQGGLAASSTFALSVLNTTPNNITGTANNDVLTGTAEGDYLQGLSGNDTIDGAAGNDLIAGGPGIDTLRGNDGDDLFLIEGTDTAYDTVNGGLGTDIVLGGTGDDTFRFANFSGANTVETLDGGAGTNVIAGTGNNDVLDVSATTLLNINKIDAGAGNDTVTGSAGNDLIVGGGGIDTLRGGDGDDLFRIEGTDTAYDTVNGGLGLDTVLGGTGDDTFRFANFSGDNTVEAIDGAGGTNVIAGTANNDVLDLSGTSLVNIGKIDAGAGNDTVTGSAGDDWIVGGSGIDTLRGGDGDDTFSIEGTDAAYDTVNGGAGFDTVLGGAGDDTFRFANFSGDNTVEVIDGAAGTNTLAGTANNDVLDFSATTLLNINKIDAGAGNDTVTGSAGDDLIFGGAGIDTLRGGDGDDTFSIEGTDTAYDTVNGGLGTDTVVGGTGDDTFRFANFSGDNTVEVIDGAGGTNVIAGTANNDVLDLSNTALLNISKIDAGAGNDTVTGSIGNDLIIGGSGIDTLRGGDGNDTFLIEGTDPAYDTINGGLGTDTVLGGTGDDTFRFANFSGANTVEIIDGSVGTNTVAGTANNDVLDLSNTTLLNISKIDAGAGNDTVTGSRGNDVIFGGAGVDTLRGGDGDDTLDGGTGNDTLNGGAGNDTYVFNVGYGSDSLTDNDATAGNQDTVSLGVDRLNTVFVKSGNNLQIQLHGGTDTLTVNSWYSGTVNQTEVIKTQDGATLLNTQVDQLIQAMAQFSASHGGITWDQAIDQNPNEVQAVISAYWQSA